MMRKVHQSNPTKVEAKILAKYDYAWNKKSLGRSTRRPFMRGTFTLSE